MSTKHDGGTFFSFQSEGTVGRFIFIGLYTPAFKQFFEFIDVTSFFGRKLEWSACVSAVLVCSVSGVNNTNMWYSRLCVVECGVFFMIFDSKCFVSEV